MDGSAILAKTIQAAILSTKVSAPDCVPPSLLIVAPFENGKTSIVLRNAGQKQLVLTDLTGMGLLGAIKANPEAATIIINDMTAITGHRAAIPKLTIAVLNALAEEGVYQVAVPGLGDLSFSGRKMNMICCLVPELMNDKRNWWHKSGFLSRVLVLKYRHSLALQMQIHESIARGQSSSMLPSSTLTVPSAPIRVNIPKEIAYKIRSLAETVATELGEFGYRKHKQLRALAAGHALLRSWKNPTVGERDVEFLTQVLGFVRGREI